MIFTLYHHSKKDSASRPSSSGSPRLLTESPPGIVGETSGETTPLQHVGPVEEAAPACSSMRPRRAGARRSPCTHCDLSLWWHSNVPEAGRVSHEKCSQAQAETRNAPLYCLADQNAIAAGSGQPSQDTTIQCLAKELLAERCTYLVADTPTLWTPTWIGLSQ